MELRVAPPPPIDVKLQLRIVYSLYRVDESTSSYIRTLHDMIRQYAGLTRLPLLLLESRKLLGREASRFIATSKLMVVTASYTYVGVPEQRVLLYACM